MSKVSNVNCVYIDSYGECYCQTALYFMKTTLNVRSKQCVLLNGARCSYQIENGERKMTDEQDISELIKSHMKLLGRKGKDRVTGFEGVTTSLGFDVYGCVQIVLTPPVKEGEYKSGHWFDVTRLEISDERVIDVPNYYKGYVEPDPVHIASGKKGAADKPVL